MNNYISAEEFLKQSDKVQRVFKELYECETILFAYSYNITKYSIIYGEFSDKICNIPLLQMHQLIDFIETKLNCKIFYTYNVDKTLTLYKGYFLNYEYCTELLLYKSKGNLLESLFKIACEIAESED